LKAPAQKRDTAWHSRQLDLYFAVHDQLEAVLQQEISLDKSMIRLQVEQEKLCLQLMENRTDLKKKRERRKRLVRAAMALNKRVRTPNVQLKTQQLKKK
jgi:hypothetical protein